MCSILKKFLLCSVLFLLAQRSFSQIKANQDTVPISEIKVLGEDEIAVPLKELLKPGQKLFYRINSIYCGPCVEREFAFLNKLGDQLPSNSIIVLTSFVGFRNYLAFVRDHRGKFQVYNLDSLKISMDNTKQEGAFYFNISKEKILENVFFSDKQSPESSRKYLKKISKSLFGVEPVI